MSGLRDALSLALALAFAPLCAAAQPAAAPLLSQPLPQDPAIRRGVLPNGLRYAVLSNPTPKAGVSVRLAMDVGSYEETDAERGAAHFVEHLAFRSTRSFPEGLLEATFAPIGVGFGRDHNATTTLHTTVYQLDLPDTEDQHLDLAFRWLRDVADGLTFDPAATNRERGVVLAEKEARNSPAAAVQEAMTRFQGPELRSTLRDPIGTDAVLRSITPEALKAFHSRWYRPENAVVVVVGDLPAEALEARVKAAFSSWTAAGPPAPPPPPGRLDAKRGVVAVTTAAATLPTTLTACRVNLIPPASESDVASLRRRALRDMWRHVMDRRMTQAKLREPGLLGAVMVFSDDRRDAQSACLLIVPAGEAWEAALAASQGELRRFERDGPTELETEQALRSQRASLLSAITQAPTRNSGPLATAIAESELERRTVMAPREALRLFNLAMEDVTAADVKQAFRLDWAGAGPLLGVTAPKPPTGEALVAAWTRNTSGDAPSTYTDTKVASWAYGPLPAAGNIARRETLPDFTRIRFQNGVVLNLKKTSYEAGAIQIWIQFGAGRREIPNKVYFASHLAAGLFPYGGVGRHSFEELQALFGSAAPAFDMDVTDYSFIIRHTASTDDLIYRLRLLSVYLSDPGFRDTLDAKIPTALDMTYRTFRTNLGLVVRQALAEEVDPGSSMIIPTPAELGPMGSREFSGMLKAAVTEAPLDITLVGDFDEAEAISHVAQTFGALPPRALTDRVRADTSYMRYPRTAPPEIHTVHDGPADKAAVAVIWPLYVATPARRREEYALRTLAEIFNNELRHSVRERLGKTYAPQVDASTPDDADQGELAALVETYPADLNMVRDEILTVAARLAAGGITPDMLEAARAPELTRWRTAMRTNSWLTSALSGSSINDQNLRDARAYDAMISAVTLQDLKQAAATWLTRAPFVITALPAATPQETAR